MTHVLIVEDDEPNLKLLGLLLGVNGYRVSVARDGLEALAAARRDPPDVIVSDALMPNMDGFSLCREWMQDAALRDIPFVFYSATYVRAEDAQTGLALGAARYLIKPMEAKAFLWELAAVLQQWAGRAAPVRAVPLDEAASRALHESALMRKLEDKMAQLEAANRRLQESEARFRNLAEMSSDFYWESDAEHRLALRTPAAKKTSAVSVFARGAQIGERRWDIPYLTPDAAGWATHRAILDAHRPFRDFVLSRMGADGTERFISISGDPVFDAAGAFTGYRGVGSDITERRRFERDLRASEERWKFALEGAGDGVWDRNMQTGEVRFSARWKEMLGYADEEIAPQQEEWLSRIHPEDLPRVIADVKACTDGIRTTYSNERRMRHKDGSWLWVLARGKVVSHSPDGRPLRMIGTHTDISERKRVEEQIQHYVAQLETAFMSTVQVATTLGEMRDPYTAGHQRRVAEIAVAIGAELGFDARRQEGLRVAGYLHDIGKITIPAEILSKPGRLSPTEFKLVQGHAQSSYDVLKEVRFPWPVAEIARQHHERMDGSGYPQGLKGEAILLDARVMAVADVLEAMSSHRPYRAGLGLAKALAEIERGRGSAYDADVVDASLRLYREQRRLLPD